MRLGNLGGMTIADALAQTTVASLNLIRHVAVAPDTAVADVVAEMREAELSTACVVDDRELLGVFTQRDVLHRVIGRRRDWNAPITGEMTSSLKTTTPDTSLADALDAMTSWWVRDLPVLDDDQGFVGCLSYFTVVETMAALLAQQLEGPLADDVIRESLAFVDFTGINLRPPVAVSADAPVEIAIHNLRNRGLEQVVVTDERGHLVGVVTEFALMMGIGCDPIDLATTLTSEVMVPEPNTISVRASIADAIATFRARETSNVALVGETGQPAGVASFRQVLGFVESGFEAEQAAHN